MDATGPATGDTGRVIDRANRLPGGPAPLAVLAFAAGLAGVTTLVVGTFLPWLHSGAVDRSLYQTAAVAQRLGLLGDGSLLSTWLPLVGPICVAPVLLALLRLRRSAAVVGLVVAIGAGGCASVTLAMAGSRSALGISLAWAGPVTVLVGAALLALGATVLLAGTRRARPAPGTMAMALAENAPSTVVDPSH